MLTIRRVRRLGVAAVLLLGAIAVLPGQAVAPSLDQPYAGDRNITGQAVPGAVPLTAYDMTTDTKVYLGSGKSADQQGYFAVAVAPPLILGHKIVVVDSQGRSSPTVTVAAKTGPAGPSN